MTVRRVLPGASVAITSLLLLGCGGQQGLSAPNGNPLPTTPTQESAAASSGGVAKHNPESKAPSPPADETGTLDDQVSRPVDEPAGYFDNLKARLSATNFDFYFDSILEALPNTTFEVNGRSVPASTVAVTGVVVTVDSRDAFADPLQFPELAEDGEAGLAVTVDFDDPRALWRTFDVVVEVDEVLGAGPEVEVADAVTFVVAADAVVTTERVVSDLLARPDVLVIGTGPGTTEQPFLVAFNGGFWFLRDSADRIEAPGMEGFFVTRLGVDTVTVGDLRAAAAGPPRSLAPHWARDD